MTTPIQRTFAGGEISPSLYSRVDTSKYQTGLKKIRNTIVMGEGGAANRPGFEYIVTPPASWDKCRLIDFEFNDDQTYILMFGNQKLRILKNGEYLIDTSFIGGATQASPCVLAQAYDGVQEGAEITISNIVGMTELNGRTFIATNVTHSSIELYDFDGNPVDSTGYSAYVSGGRADFIRELSTPYADSDLDLVQYAQSADVVTLTHRSYPAYELSRFTENFWLLSEAEFLDTTGVPNSISASGGGTGTSSQEYTVTAFNRNNGKETLSGYSAGLTISSITNANPAVVTLSSSAIQEGEVEIVALGMTELNGKRFIAANIGGYTFELYDQQLKPVDSTSFGVFTSGTAYNTFLYYSGTAAPTPSNPILITWANNSWTAGTTEFNVYKFYYTGYRLIGSTVGTSFYDVGITPVGSSPPQFQELFNSDGNYPGVCSYIQQSLVMASTNAEPEKLWKSKIGDYSGFIPHYPIQSDDPTIFTMAGNKVNQIRHVIDLAKMVILTSSGEWTAEGSDGVVTPTSINLKQHSQYGSSYLRPLIIGEGAIFVQARGAIVRDLSFNWETQGYQGNDLTKFARHFFKGYTIVSWAYQQNPDSIVWAVRNDGKLFGLTYVREHQIWGWHQHDTDGVVEDVAVVSEGDQDSLYAVIVRTVNGVSTRMIERMSYRYEQDMKDMAFMDSRVTYDGRNTGSNTMTLSTGGGWTTTDTLTITCSADFFTSDDVGNQIHFTADDGSTVRVNIAAFTSATVVTGTPEITVPSELHAAATATWARAVDEVIGLYHLEGKAVSIFADGFVLASPNNSNYEIKTVASGTITLSECFSVIHIGLPYTSDIVTLEIDSPDGGSYTSQKKLSSQIDVRVQDSRGIWIGAELPDDDSTDGLYEYKQKYVEDGVAAPLVSEVIEQRISGKWSRPGGIAIRQVDPLPLQVLSISPSVMIEEGGA